MKHRLLTCILPVLLTGEFLSSCASTDNTRTVTTAPDGTQTVTEPAMNPKDAAFNELCKKVLEGGGL